MYISPECFPCQELHVIIVDLCRGGVILVVDPISSSRVQVEDGHECQDSQGTAEAATGGTTTVLLPPEEDSIENHE